LDRHPPAEKPQTGKLLQSKIGRSRLKKAFGAHTYPLNVHCPMEIIASKMLTARFMVGSAVNNARET